jgi:hypothetical protein
MTTRAGFVAFIRKARIVLDNGTIVTVDSTALPDNSSDIDEAYNYALSIVATEIETMNALDYARAVYNLAMHDLIVNSTAAVFDAVKASYRLTLLKTGFVQSTGDEGTSTSYAMAGYLTQQNAAFMELNKTSFGMQYIAVISRYQPLASFYVG